MVLNKQVTLRNTKPEVCRQVCVWLLLLLNIKSCILLGNPPSDGFILHIFYRGLILCVGPIHDRRDILHVRTTPKAAPKEMSELPEPESKVNQDPEQEYKVENAPILESNDAKTPSAATFVAKRTTDIDDVTGDDFCITTTERISLRNPQTYANPTGNNNAAAPSVSMGISARNGFGNDALGEGVELYSSKNPPFNGEDVNRGGQKPVFYAQEGYNGQVQQPQPRGMLYDDKSRGPRSEADGSVLSTSYAGIVSRADSEDGYMNPTESQQPGWEDHAEDENGDHSSKNDVVGENEKMHGVVVPTREVIDGSRMTETDHGQIVDATEGADNIPGVDDLPIFANEQSKALNDEIKVNRQSTTSTSYT